MDVPARRALRPSSHTRRSLHSSQNAPPSSASSTAASDEPAMGSSLAREQHRRDIQNSRTRTSIDPYSTVGQLSYAPATQTTVVTTTTTTTTSFPPMLMKPPQALRNKDPKQFPLACSPTPHALRQFNLNIGGRPAYFEEQEDSQEALRQYSQEQSHLATLDGAIRRVEKDQVSYGTPERALAKHKSRHVSGYTAATSPSMVSRRSRRDASPLVPPSLAEAAEIASLQRRTKKTRGSVHRPSSSRPSFELSADQRPAPNLDDSGPATPDTDAGTFLMPPVGRRIRRPSLKSSKTASASSLEGDARLHTRSSLARHSDLPRALASSSRTRAPAVGVAATPPIVEGDLERFGSFESEEPSQESQPSRRPNAIDSLVAQDASLPSPSLSPITHAATFGHNALGIHDQEEDDNEVSSLDISRDSLEGKNSKSLIKRRASASLEELDLSQALADASPNPQLPTPTFMDIPTMFDSFDSMPLELQQYVMYQLLRRCNKPTLQFVAGVVNPALKCDFLSLLPLELSLNITKHLDAKSMCRAARVSHKWREIVDSDEATWSQLLHQDGFEIPKGELERAIREGWGWQFPVGHDSGEEDFSPLVSSQDVDFSAITDLDQLDAELRRLSPPGSAHGDSDMTLSGSTRSKRKATAKQRGSSKRQKRTAPTSRQQIAPFLVAAPSTLSGPNAHAAQARRAVSEPAIGLPTLRNMHLYKSLYRRHFLIRKSWMEEDVRPRHIAFRAHQRHVVTCLQFDTDKILTGSDDTKINVYDTKTGAKRKTLEGHEGGVWALEYEGNTLVSGSTDRSVRVWNIETGKCVQVFQGHTSTVRCLVILKPAQVGMEADGTPIMMPKQPLIITGSRDSSLRVWMLPKVTDAAPVATAASGNDYGNPYFVRALTAHHHSVRAIAAHGDTLVSGSYDCTVRVWKISTGEMQHRLGGHTQKVYSVVLDHERNRCISGSMDNMVKVWSLEHGHCVFNLEGHTSLVGLLDLSHERLVSAAADSTLRVWDPQNGQCKATLTAHTGAITCFQHDDHKVISGSDRTLKMWNMATGECVKDLLTDLSGVWQVRFNERRCVAAVQRNNLTFIEVLDFGASRDGVPRERRGVRIVVDRNGRELAAPPEVDEIDDAADARSA